MAEEKALIQKFGDQSISTAVHPPVLSGPPPGFTARTKTVEITVNNDKLHPEATAVQNSPSGPKSHSTASVTELKIETSQESVAYNRLSLSTTSPTKRSSTDTKFSPKNPPSPNEVLMNDESVEIGRSPGRGQKRVKNLSTSNSEESGVGDRLTDLADNRPAIPPKPTGQKKPRGGGALPALSNRISRSLASPANHPSPSASARAEAPVSIGRGRGMLGVSKSSEDTPAPFGGRGRGRGRGYMKT